MLTEPGVTTEALSQLAVTLESLDIGPGAPSAVADRDRLVDTIRSYLIPRAVEPWVPMTVVVAGPTGSGKSTVVNSLSGTDSSRTGALRPTTTKPVALARPRHTADFQVVGGVRCDTFAVDAPILENMVLIDAPDIDSTSTRHRAMAEILIDNADVVVFVTSALRYADEVPWQILRRARSRGAPVIHVLNRVESASAGSVVDFRSRLTAAGMDDDLVVISEHHLPECAHRVPAVAVRALHDRLAETVAGRDVVTGLVFRGVLSATLTQVIELTDEVGHLHDAIEVFENEMADRLLERVSRLSLRDVAEGLHPGPPERPTRHAIRRWRKGSARPESEVEATESVVVERIATVMTADVRQWLVEEQEALREHDIDARSVIDGVVTASRVAVEGWVDYVTRIAVDVDGGDPWLGEAVLIEAVTVGETTRAAEALFAEDGPVLVDRARRELVGRLEVVYRRVAVLLADILRERYGEADDTELRDAVGAVAATLVPVDA